LFWCVSLGFTLFGCDCGEEFRVVSYEFRAASASARVMADKPAPWVRMLGERAFGRIPIDSAFSLCFPFESSLP
jgi:hypothetical protein